MDTYIPVRFKSTSHTTPELTRQNFEIKGICTFVHKVSNPYPVRLARNAHCWQRALGWGASGWEGRGEKDVGKRVESAWSCRKGSEENHMHTTMRFLGMALWFPILGHLGRVQWETAPNKLRAEENKTVLCLQNRNNSSLLRWPCRCQNAG